MRALLLAAVLLAGPALACGVCVEDKIAACYDHAVIAGAHARGYEVAFFAVQGAPVQAGALKKVIESSPGVQPGSARVSAENGALSFAYDPKRSNAVSIADRIERRTRLGLGLLQVSR